VATYNYLMMLGVASVLALLLALAGHCAHAWLAVPDRWHGDVLGRSPDPPYPGAEYDEQGFWEFASLRNFLYYAGGYLLTVWGLGAWYWGEKQAALASVCRTVAHIGIVPVFCM
jgi:hypothetical protein